MFILLPAIWFTDFFFYGNPLAIFGSMWDLFIAIFRLTFGAFGVYF
jgi:hypothetical protein